MSEVQKPLAVDLDGTLIKTDLLHELCIGLLATKPYLIWKIAFYLVKGKAHLKEWLVKSVALDIASLPYNQEVISWLSEQKRAGRKLVLCTASDQLIAERIANYLGIFDEVIGSSGGKNNAGNNKALWLCLQYGERKFAYAGNSNSDLMVWGKSGSAILVNFSKDV
ncbi:MAG: haloacid dehalogenase-like hydrolase, partial [Polynucleobacter sp.]